MGGLPANLQNCPPHTHTHQLQDLLGRAPAKQLPAFSFPKKSQDLHVAEVTDRWHRVRP